MRLRTVREVIQTHFELKAHVMGAPSPLGAQLQAARLGLTGERAFDQGDFDKDWLRYVQTSKLLAEVSEEEYRVLELLFCGIVGYLDGRTGRPAADIETYERTVPSYELHDLYVPVGDGGGECGARTQTGLPCRRARPAGEPRCTQHAHLASPVATKVTRSGEELVTYSSASPDHAIVLGTRAKRPCYEEVGHAIGITGRQVRSRLKAAYAKVFSQLHVAIEL